MFYIKWEKMIKFREIREEFIYLIVMFVLIMLLVFVTYKGNKQIQENLINKNITK